MIAAGAPVTAEDEDFLGLPGLLTPEQTAALLATRDVDLRRRVQAASRTGGSLLPDAQAQSIVVSPDRRTVYAALVGSQATVTAMGARPRPVAPITNCMTFCIM